MYTYRLSLKNGKDVDNFVKIMQDNKIEGKLSNELDAPQYMTKNNTILGVLPSLEWAKIYLETEQDIKDLIEEFIYKG